MWSVVKKKINNKTKFNILVKHKRIWRNIYYSTHFFKHIWKKYYKIRFMTKIEQPQTTDTDLKLDLLSFLYLKWIVSLG